MLKYKILFLTIISLIVLTACISNANTRERHGVPIKPDKNKCSTLWQVEDENGRCEPKFYLEVCGENFECSNKRLGDKFRLTETPIECIDGKITIYKLPTTTTKSSIDDTLVFLDIEVLACSHVDKLPP